jgi:hypothetical protein
METFRAKRNSERQQKFRRHALLLYPYCQWCGCSLTAETATTDHLIPLSRDGSNEWDNLCLACFDCNQRRKNDLPEQSPAGPRWSKSKPVPKFPLPDVLFLVAWTRYPNGRWRRTFRGHFVEDLEESLANLMGMFMEVVILPEGLEPGT